MTSRERLLVALRGGAPDRVPVAPFGMGRIHPETDLGRELIRSTDIFIDVWGGGAPFLGSAAVVRQHEDGDTVTVVYETPKGDLTRRIRRTPVTSATVEFPFKTLDDVERFLSIPFVPSAIDLSAYRAWRERIGDEGFVMIGLGNAVCLPAEWFSPEAFALAWADAPDLLCDLVRTAAERLEAYVERLCAMGVEGFRIVGGEYVTVQLGPRAFDALITPHDRRLCDLIRRHGAVAYYHNHGPVCRYLPRLADLGMDALDPLEAPPWGDAADLADVRAIVGDRLCLVGNLDDMEALESLPTAAVLEIARERLRQGGSTAFVLGGTASGTYTEAGARNFIAMARMVASL